MKAQFICFVKFLQKREFYADGSAYLELDISKRSETSLETMGFRILNLKEYVDGSHNNPEVLEASSIDI